MKNSKRLLCFVLTVLFLAVLCGCGGEDEKASADSLESKTEAEIESSVETEQEEYLGTYSCSHISMYGVDFAASEVYSNESSITLKKNGQALFILDGTQMDAAWSATGASLQLESGEDTFSGTIGNGVICLNHVSGSEMDIYFAKAGVELTESAETGNESSEAVTPLQQTWNGIWYGWWSIANPEGLWESVGSGAWWDCLAEVSVDEQGSGTLTLWHEESSREEPIAQMDVVATEQALVSENGYFWMEDLESGSWTFNLGSTPYENLIILDNLHYEGLDGVFDYVIYLRPWGQSWDDIAQADENSLPRYYEDWYLPMLESGAQPDIINQLG